ILADVRNCISLGWVRVLSSLMLSSWSSRNAPQFADFVLSPLPSLFAHLVATFIAACVSSDSPFFHVCHFRCTELISWSLDLLYPELCGYLLAWVLVCACLVCEVLLTS
ncbi:hypothetical protein HID58_061325, partial [Brassica napus]